MANKKEQDNRVYCFSVNHVALKQFGEVIDYFSHEVKCKESQAYVKLINEAKRRHGLSYEANLSFDRTKIVKGREVLPHEYGWPKKKYPY